MAQTDFRTYYIAKLYYIDHIKQNDIAQRLGLSNMLVSRILKKAEAEGIVSFQVRSPNQLDWAMGYQIKQRYPALKEALVVQLDANEDARHRIATVAAEYIGDLLCDGVNIGVSWGQTICEIARVMRGGSYPNTNVLQMSGGFLCETDGMMMPSNIIQLISNRLQCKAVFLNAPLLVSSGDVSAMLRTDPLYQHIQDMAQHMHIALYGLSALGHTATMAQVGALSQEDIDELRSLGAIGDIMGYFIDEAGNMVNWSKQDCYMGVPVEVTAKATNAICVAGEPEKAAVLRRVVEKKLCNTLIITDTLAESLLHRSGEESKRI